MTAKEKATDKTRAEAAYLAIYHLKQRLLKDTHYSAIPDYISRHDLSWRINDYMKQIAEIYDIDIKAIGSIANSDVDELLGKIEKGFDNE